MVALLPRHSASAVTAAGLDGQGGSSYIDLVICRNK
jgi:hypothetical protein